MARRDYINHARHKKPPERTKALARRVEKAAKDAEDLIGGLRDYEEHIASANMEQALLALREAALAVSVVVGSLPAFRDADAPREETT